MNLRPLEISQASEVVVPAEWLAWGEATGFGMGRRALGAGSFLED